MVNRTRHTNNVCPMMLTLIDNDCSPLRYVILDCPTESTLDFYIDQFVNLNVKAVVRCCQPTYNPQRLTDQGIDVIGLPFKDGGVPPPQIVQEWLQLLDKLIHHTLPSEPIKPTIAVHCVAGLGRAPVLVAIALIETGMNALDAIEYIRTKRWGAFNKPQIAFLDTYKRTMKVTSHAPLSAWRASLGKMFRINSH
ncbi:protein-tyrosine phosphatase-like protein [Dichotomocladium elegans]|nr:protein-tyrosine phosphatase-like protein [Dichotomocladium elegans]